MWVALASCGDRAGRLDGIEQQGNDHSRTRRKEDQSHRYHGKRGTCGRADRRGRTKALLLRTNFFRKLQEKLQYGTHKMEVQHLYESF